MGSITFTEGAQSIVLPQCGINSWLGYIGFVPSPPADRAGASGTGNFLTKCGSPKTVHGWMWCL